MKIQGKYQGDFCHIKVTHKVKTILEDVFFYLKHCDRFKKSSSDIYVYLETEDENQGETYQISFYCDTMNDLLVRVFLNEKDSREIHNTLVLFDNRDESEYLLITR